MFPAQNNPSDLTAKILSISDIFMKKNQRPLDDSLGFHSRVTQISFENPSSSSKGKQFRLQQPLDFGRSAKGREAELLASCNMIGGN